NIIAPTLSRAMRQSRSFSRSSPGRKPNRSVRTRPPVVINAHPMPSGTVRLGALDAPAAKTGHLVFASGQIASVDGAGVAPEARIDPAFPYYGSAIKRQTRFILDKLSKTFEAAGTSLDHAVKAHVFHSDLRNFDAFDEVWREYFPKQPPCRATVGMAGNPVPGCLVQVDLLATPPST